MLIQNRLYVFYILFIELTILIFRYFGNFFLEFIYINGFFNYFKTLKYKFDINNLAKFKKNKKKYKYKFENKIYNYLLIF